MQIVLHCGGIPFNGQTIFERSLGGSESAGYYLALELAKRGHEVTVFTNHPQGGEFDGVTYVPAGEIRKETPLGSHFHFWASHTPHDLLIIQRVPGFIHKFNCKVSMWWLHDLALKRSEQGVMQQMWQVDRVLSVSEWHKRQIESTWDIDPEFISVANNGVDYDLYDRPYIQVDSTRGKYKMDRERRSVLWCSRPERGLDNLLTIAHRCPEVDFYICGYQLELGDDHPNYPLYQSLSQRVQAMSNVHDLGALRKQDLADLQRAVDMWIYPTTFEETSCITAMEFMAAGINCVTTDAGALPETMKNYGGHMCIPLKDGQVDIDQFVETVKNGRLNRTPPKATYRWAYVAEDVETYAFEEFAKKNANSMVSHMVRRNDIVALHEYGPTLASHGEEVTDWLHDEMALYRPHRQGELEGYYDHYYRSSLFDVQKEMERDGTVNTGRYQAVVMQLQALNETHRGQDLKVLDYGCFTGNYTHPLSQAFPGWNFDGVEFADEALKAARSRDDRCAYYKSLSDILPGEYDVIMVNEVLEHVWDWRELIEKLAEHAHEDTLWIITTPYGEWEYLGRKANYTYRFHLHEFERDDLREMFGGSKRFSMNCVPVNPMLGSWLTTFTGLPVLNDINYPRKFQMMKPRQAISLCMIAKNAGIGVTKTLESALPHVSEVVVAIDETSDDDDITDGVIANLCEQYGVPCSILDGESPLQTGFDEARNRVIANASFEWIMWLDCDEHLITTEHLGQLLRNNQWNGYAANQAHISSLPAGVLTTDFPVRLFRNFKNIQFYGRVHEHPETAVNEGIGRAWHPPEFRVIHYGYETEAIRQRRFHRNFPLMVRDREDYPDRKLGKWLWVRDLEHLNRYEFQSTNAVSPEMVQRAEEGIAVWKEVVADGELRYAIESLAYMSPMAELLGLGFAAEFTLTTNGQTQTIKGRFPDKQSFKDVLALASEEGLSGVEHPHW